MTFKKYICLKCFYLFQKHYLNDLKCPHCQSPEIEYRGEFKRKQPWPKKVTS